MTVAVAPLSDIDKWVRSDLLLIVLFIIGAILLARFVGWLSAKVIERIDAEATGADALVRSEAEKHRHAVAQVVTWVTIVLIYCVATVLVVQRFGVPLAGLVAPATVAGVALGFGAQRIVQDILAGFFLLAERQYGFGDVVRIAAGGSSGTVTGTVEEVTLRITRLRSANGEVVIVPNGQVIYVTNLSRDWARAVIDVPVPSTADIARVTDVLHQVCVDAYADEELRPLLLDPPSVMGVESLGVDELQVRVVARTLPGRQFEVGRALRGRIALAFGSAGLAVGPGLTTADVEAADQ
ncbi:MAG: moderate conductance mechanosensitive channel [Frankiaceae bacterium]|jgi:small conductance mechanosensitive channel|nr:moderate conductance mechanosensitive channel [Frankiaceae bacterium]